MAKFCRSCGAPLEEGAEKCSACGAIVNREAAAAAKAKQTSETLNKVSDVINTIFCVAEKVLRLAAAKVCAAVKNAQAAQAAKAADPANPGQAVAQRDTSLNVVRLAIIVVLIVLALIGTIMNLAMKYDVEITATVSYGSEKSTTAESGPIGDLADADEFIGFILVNLIWAVFNIVLIVMAILVILKVLKLANSDGRYKALAMTGLIGDVLYMILYKICGSGTQEVWGATMKYSVGFHYFVWIHVVCFALALVLAYLSLKPAAPAAAETPAE